MAGNFWLTSFASQTLLKAPWPRVRISSSEKLDESLILSPALKVTGGSSCMGEGMEACDGVGNAAGGDAMDGIEACSDSTCGGFFSSRSTNSLLAFADGSRDGRLSSVAYRTLDGNKRASGGSKRVGGEDGGELSGDATDELAVVKDRTLGGGVGCAVPVEAPKKSAFRDRGA